MSYRISYTSNGAEKKKYRIIRISSTVATFLCVAIIMTIGYVLHLENADHLLRMLYPWKATYINDALCILESSIRQGEPIIEAVETFFKYIIQYAAV